MISLCILLLGTICRRKLRTRTLHTQLDPDPTFLQLTLPGVHSFALRELTKGVSARDWCKGKSWVPISRHENHETSANVDSGGVSSHMPSYAAK